VKYFTYSPLDMDAQEAFSRAQPSLDPAHIVDVTHYGNYIRRVPSGTRPKALPDTYLVRVEQDGSLRIVQKSLN
jgi:hypothetical protein